MSAWDVHAHFEAEHLLSEEDNELDEEEFDDDSDESWEEDFDEDDSE